MALEIVENMTNTSGEKGFGIMDGPIACQFYATREEAEEGLIHWKNEAAINDFIEDQLDWMESVLCNRFGVADIEPARKIIKEYTRFGY